MATPGRNGIGASAAAFASAGDVPGLTRNFAPASTAAWICAGSTMVPAPTWAPGTLRAISAMASSAAGVRSVTSMAGRPPATSARACATPSATSRTVSTGITGASCMIATTAAWRALASMRVSFCAAARFRRGDACKSTGDRCAAFALKLTPPALRDERLPAHDDFSLYREALLFLATAGVVAPLFVRLRVSPVLGYVLAGAALGPFGLGRLARARRGSRACC